jgi:hypothetical protein
MPADWWESNTGFVVTGLGKLPSQDFKAKLLFDLKFSLERLAKLGITSTL